MEEMETPIEKVHEQIHETAENSKESWISQVALFSALVAVVAAISALMAGHHSNEALIAQVKAANAWNYYQAKGVKSSVLSSKMQLLIEMGRKPDPADAQKLENYKKDQDEISETAKTLEEQSEHHLKTHEILARTVTLFQVAIAISAISVLTKRKRFWFVGIGFSLIGFFFFIQGWIQS
jgi:Domain of unknown function (DUF4337)